jgi:hypothetical protein
VLIREGYVALLLLCLTAVQCKATTSIFVVTPNGIVAGADNLITAVSFRTGAVTPPAFGTKIALVKGRFIVASLGTESIKRDGASVRLHAMDAEDRISTHL